MCFFFFFKQKTAYEMRISDWSSDVCSSDLAGNAVEQAKPGFGKTEGDGRSRRDAADDRTRRRAGDPRILGRQARLRKANPGLGAGRILPEGDRDHHIAASSREGAAHIAKAAGQALADGRARERCREIDRIGRSEEHTSELQSLM